MFGSFLLPGELFVNNLTIAALDPVSKIPEHKVYAVRILNRPEVLQSGLVSVLFPRSRYNSCLFNYDPFARCQRAISDFLTLRIFRCKDGETDRQWS